MSRRRDRRDGHGAVDPRADDFVLPWAPPAEIVPIAGRGEFFARVHRHDDPGAPWLVLLHGWTASADLQFFTAYRELAERYSFVALDHRGHGRGLRTSRAFRLADVADDVAAILAELGVGPVVAVGYSMGGPVAMLFARRHPTLVSGLVVQATALEWRRARRDRLTWYGLPLLGASLRAWWFPRYMSKAIARVVPVGHELEVYLPWMLGEMQRGSTHAIVEAGRELKHHDATDWAAHLGVPAGSLITTRDRLVRPSKQRTLAGALGASVRELAADHFVTLSDPAAYAEATVELVAEVVSAAGPSTASARAT